MAMMITACFASLRSEELFFTSFAVRAGNLRDNALPDQQNFALNPYTRVL
jgi:hypothetical protein